MTQVSGQSTTEVSPAIDLAAAIQGVLRSSPEPLTVSKIRASLPAPFRHASVEELAEVLRRHVAASVLWSYPRYRSQQERFWDRPMPVHVAELLRAALDESPLSWSDLRRRLPVYAHEKAQTVLEEQVAQGGIHRHPRFGRAGERFGRRPADPKEYLRSELAGLFECLEKLGFSEGQLREAALELLHDEEWSPARSTPPTPESEGSAQDAPRPPEQQQDLPSQASIRTPANDTRAHPDDANASPTQLAH
jgi:hypothetical protein